MELSDQLKGVTSPSPATPEPVEPDPVEPDPVEPEPGKPDTDDRPPENIKGEVLRKLNEAKREQDAKIDAIATRFEAALQDVAGRLQAPPKAPTAKPGGNPLDQYDVDQLQAALVSDQVDEPTKQSIQAYLPVRVAREEARRIGEENRTIDAAHRTRSEANQAAVDRYPDLMKPDSQMHVEVNRILRSRGTQWAENNPTAVLDAANEAALKLGVGMDLSGRRPRVPGLPPGSQGGAPVKKQEDSTGMTDAEIDAIAPKLEYLLGRDKNGKPKKFDRKFLKERSKLYEDRY